MGGQKEGMESIESGSVQKYYSEAKSLTEDYVINAINELGRAGNKISVYNFGANDVQLRVSDTESDEDYDHYVTLRSGMIFEEKLKIGKVEFKHTNNTTLDIYIMPAK